MDCELLLISLSESFTTCRLDLFPGRHNFTMIRVFDPYAIALSLLVGGVGFGMTFYFNTRVSAWGSEEIAYPALAMVSRNQI